MREKNRINFRNIKILLSECPKLSQSILLTFSLQDPLPESMTTKTLKVKENMVEIVSNT